MIEVPVIKVTPDAQVVGEQIYADNTAKTPLHPDEPRLVNQCGLPDAQIKAALLQIKAFKLATISKSKWTLTDKGLEAFAPVHLQEDKPKTRRSRKKKTDAA